MSRLLGILEELWIDDNVLLCHVQEWLFRNRYSRLSVDEVPVLLDRQGMRCKMLGYGPDVVRGLATIAPGRTPFPEHPHISRPVAAVCLDPAAVQ